MLLALAFAATIGHAVLLANGRRSLAVALGTLPGTVRPAWAGVATGSFVDEPRRRSSRGARRLRRAEPALERRALADGRRIRDPRRLDGHSRRHRRPRAVGQPVRVLGRVRDVDPVRLPRPLAPLPDPLDRVHPGRRLAALLLYASSLPNDIKPLVPALQNAPLLTIHVGLAMLCYGIFATSFAAGVGYLVQGKDDRFAWLPSHRVLDKVAYRAVIIGFPIFATMIILGSWWASIAWSRYWGWDPKETSALVTWLVYAIYLHARNQRAWAGRPAALLLVVGFGMVLLTYSGSLWFNGLHAYSGL